MNDEASQPSGEPSSHRHWLLREPARPRWVAASPRAPWLVVGTVCVGAFMGQLDASIVSVALPAIGHDLGGSTGQVEWVALSYLLTLVALVAPIGRWADSVGRKLLYSYGFAVFGAASLACGLAPNLLMLNVFRVLQAVGAAMLQANSVALIAIAAPPGKLGKAVGIQGAAQAVGLAVGPAVGGLLLQLGSWRLLFDVNVPASILGLAAGWVFLPRSRELQPRSNFDWTGLALFVPAVGGLMLVLSLAVQHPSPALLVGIPVAVLALGTAFYFHVRRHPAPVIDLRLFRFPAFGSGIFSGLLSYAAMFGLLFAAPNFLLAHYRLGAGPAGLALSAMPVAIGLAAPIAGMLADRLGSRRLTTAGMGLATLALAAIVTVPSLPVLVTLFALVGVGVGLFTPSNNAAIMGAVPRRVSGSAAGILNMTRGMGTALGVALSELVFSAASGRHTAAVGAEAAAKGAAAVAVAMALLALIAAVISALSRGSESGPGTVVSSGTR